MCFFWPSLVMHLPFLIILSDLITKKAPARTTFKISADKPATLFFEFIKLLETINVTSFSPNILEIRVKTVVEERERCVLFPQWQKRIRNENTLWKKKKRVAQWAPLQTRSCAGCLTKWPQIQQLFQIVLAQRTLRKRPAVRAPSHE